jgi:hypothetical protein
MPPNGGHRWPPDRSGGAPRMERPRVRQAGRRHGRR